MILVKVACVKPGFDIAGNVFIEVVCLDVVNQGLKHFMDWLRSVN